MSQQTPLVHLPGRGGIWRRFLLPDRRTVNAAPWLDALAQHAPVGTCRPCGGHLFPEGQPYRPAGTNRDFYGARCARCKADTAAPGPAPARKKGGRRR